jgi:hypothetical protein
MNVDKENIIASFQFNDVASYDSHDGYRKHPSFKYIFHVKKIGKQNLVLFVEEFSSSDKGYFVAKYKAKLHKQTWRTNKKAGEQFGWNTIEFSKKLDEVMAELILLG